MLAQKPSRAGFPEEISRMPRTFFYTYTHPIFFSSSTSSRAFSLMRVAVVRKELAALHYIPAHIIHERPTLKYIDTRHLVKECESARGVWQMVSIPSIVRVCTRSRFLRRRERERELLLFSLFRRTINTFLCNQCRSSSCKRSMEFTTLRSYNGQFGEDGTSVWWRRRRGK